MAEKRPIPKDPYKFDDNARNRFFAMMRETGRIYHAAKAAGVSVSLIYQLKKSDDDFAADIENALGHYRDSLEEEIHRRAVEGVIEHKYHQGLPVLDYELDPNTGMPALDADGKPKIRGQAFVRRYSDSLLTLHARRHIHEYNEKRQVDMKVSGLGGLLDEIRPSTGLPSEDEDLSDVPD